MQTIYIAVLMIQTITKCMQIIFFSSFDSFAEMRSLGMRITGTVLSNKISKYFLKNNKALKRENCESYDYKFEESMVTAFPQLSATTSLRREVGVLQPIFIFQYNKHMGEVDCLDLLTQSIDYPSDLRSIIQVIQKFS